MAKRFRKRRSMPRFRRYRHKGPKRFSIAVIGGLAGSILSAKHPWAGEGDTLVNLALNQNWKAVIEGIAPAFTGFTPDGKFHADTVLRTYGPAVAGMFIHKAMDYVGVNRSFASLPRPLNRVCI